MSRRILFGILGAFLVVFLVISGILLTRSTLFAHAADTSVSVWLSTGDSKQQLQPQDARTFADDASVTNQTMRIEVNDNLDPQFDHYQKITGFGAAITDSSAWLLQTKLSPAQRDAVMKKLFSPTDGIGIDFVRIPMGASDFVQGDAYTYDDIPSGESDPDLTHFSIDHDKAYIIPILQQALKINPALKFIATPWSPPAWMKWNDSLIGAGQGVLMPKYYDSLAQYFVKFLTAYQAAGIPIYAVTPQNEPLYATPDYPGMFWDSGSESIFIKDNLFPALVSNHLQDTKILGYDHNWDRPDYAAVLLKDATTYKDIAGTAWHCYAGDPNSMSDSIHNFWPDKEIYATECSTGGFDDTIEYLLNSTQNWSKTGELWNIALDPNGDPHNGGCSGCVGVVTVNPDNGDISYSDIYYALAHFSKFVQQGASRIETHYFAKDNTEEGGWVDTYDNVSSVSFTNPDGSDVTIVHNLATDTAIPFELRWDGTRTFHYTLPADATVTFMWAASAHVGGSDNSTTDNSGDSSTTGNPAGDSTSNTSTGNSTGPGHQPSPHVVTALNINAGGGASDKWVADVDVSGGTVPASSTAKIDTSAVTEPAPQSVYQTNRYGNFTYSIPNLAPDAPYNVRLHFAETHWTAPGQRTFNVAINGAAELNNFDIFARAGGANKAIAESFGVNASSDGVITIQFTGVTDNAQINGIELAEQTTGTKKVNINAGGGAISGWLADRDASGGTIPYANPNPVDTSGNTDPAPQSIYQTNRYGNFTYTISQLNPNAKYTVTLHFAETYWQAPGKRVFNVQINGKRALTNFDIFATAGTDYKAVVKSFTTVSDGRGNVTIQFTSVIDNAQVNGLQVSEQ